MSQRKDQPKTTTNVLEGLLGGNELYSKGMGIILYIDSFAIHSSKIKRVIEEGWRDGFLNNYSLRFIGLSSEENVFIDLYKMKLEAQSTIFILLLILEIKKPFVIHIQEDLLKKETLDKLKFFLADAIISFEDGCSSIISLQTRLSGGTKKVERFVFDGSDIISYNEEDSVKSNGPLVAKKAAGQVTDITTFNTRLTPEQERAKLSVDLPHYSIQRNLQMLDPHHRLTSMAPTLAEDCDSDDPDDDLDV